MDGNRRREKERDEVTEGVKESKKEDIPFQIGSTMR
jgi:hypothetical protein